MVIKIIGTEIINNKASDHSAVRAKYLNIVNGNSVIAITKPNSLFKVLNVLLFIFKILNTLLVLNNYSWQDYTRSVG
ncbi:hypothetical protein CSE_05220 [Caldisericum exile AZM16c01]|uniref:Uncharacterized protein n=1 Tax=Caldisericum exile (strain DSM 21853 / NBRC 104410 / AZM16c01) TaxID=511051 RepID=A0A7U6GDY1_CALEA|nr:hypothetical protein CSE_05220 [Caldisericum exile AZM16c01]